MYGEQQVVALTFIKRAKTLGFSLNEIAELMEIGEKSCQDTQKIALNKLAMIKNKIKDLEAISASLEGLVSACEANRDYEGCPIISAIVKTEIK